MPNYTFDRCCQNVCREIEEEEQCCKRYKSSSCETSYQQQCQQIANIPPVPPLPPLPPPSVPQPPVQPVQEPIQPDPIEPTEPDPDELAPPYHEEEPLPEDILPPADPDIVNITNQVFQVKQYSPDFSISSNPTRPSQSGMINALTAKSNSDPRVLNQGVNGITGNTLANTQWDGVPLVTAGKSLPELCAFLKPTGKDFEYKGLLQRYEDVKPFADEKNPTVAEIDTWNLEVIHHFRQLLGVPGTMMPDARLYLESRWSDERKFSRQWDTLYPSGTPGGATGPCWVMNGSTPTPVGDGHCAWTFFPKTEIPDYVSGTPYSNNLLDYPELSEYNARRAQSEGISDCPTWVPWGLKLAYILTNFVCTEGLLNHPGPYFAVVDDKGAPTTPRATIGMSWWYVASPEKFSYRGKYR